MPWFAVYEAATGVLRSVGSVLADPLPQGLTTREYANRPDQGARWDEVLQDFVPSPTVGPILTRVQYAQRFTQIERTAIRSSVDPVVADLVYQTGLTDAIDLSRQTVIDGVNYLESVGLLAPGRAAEILAGP